MPRKSFSRTLCALVATVSIVVTARAAPHATPAGVNNIVLVHGAWADGSSWSRVIPLLEARGFNVTAVQLPLTSLADDVATTRRAIARMVTDHPGPVLLVGHSSGGVVIGEAGNDPNVAGLVYVAAFAPDHGESAFSTLTASTAKAPLGEHLVFDEGFITLDSTGVEQDFAQCLPEIDRRVLTATQGPISGAALTGAADAPAWKAKPSWYIVARRDRAIPPELEESMAADIGAHTITLNTCHVAMLDMPFRVAAVIADAARGE